MSGEYHSLRFDSTRCDGCTACMRVCPTAAIRVRAGSARMMEDRCIDCDECLRVCPERAILPLTYPMNDLTRYDYQIAIPSPTLDGQFHRTASPHAVLNALHHCGFEEAVPESAVCDAVTHATKVFLSRYRGPHPMISSFCPAVVRLVQVKYPSLLAQLLPILAPREVAALVSRLHLLVGETAEAGVAEGGGP